MGTPFVIETKQGEKTNALLVDPDVNGQTVENKEEDVLVLYDLKDEETFIKHSIPSAFVKSIEDRQSYKIGCPEEAAFRQKFIDENMFKVLINKMPNCEYKDYLSQILKENISL